MTGQNFNRVGLLKLPGAEYNDNGHRDKVVGSYEWLLERYLPPLYPSKKSIRNIKAKCRRKAAK